MRIIELNRESRREIQKILKERSPLYQKGYEETISEIIDNVREKGDAALFSYAEKFDRCTLNKDNIRVSGKELEEAFSSVGEDFISILKAAADNIREFHERQKRQSFFSTKDDGIFLGQRIRPLKSVGVYVPGGKAAYPSSFLMDVIPAQVAGVERIVAVTPCQSDGSVNKNVLAAAKLLGIEEIYKTGGAQAIAALAFGTESVPRVDKIVGPGNIYVALAKRAVYGHVSIDSVAGPSEILVLADETAEPRFVAADLLSQAEHDEMASAILVTSSRDLADRVIKEIEAFLPQLSRRGIIEKSLDDYGFILVAEDMDEAIEAVNDIASEHLEIMTCDPVATMAKVKNAGAIFLGPYSSEPLGDYFAGPNHVLPTGGTARFFSPLSVDDFIKKSSVISYSKEALEKVQKDIRQFAEADGLTAHANSIAVRF